ncbi:MAG: LamG domain-containing protein, partial [Planctomycetota bacterium]
PDNDANDTEELYVALDGSYDEIRYTDDAGQDNNDLKLAEWTEWNIPLSDFTVDTTAATRLHIGFGDSDNTSTVGGDGVVFIDDIRLYPPRCVPEIRPFAEDLSGPYGEKDCTIDYYDVAAIADQWLRTDACLPTLLPSPGPVAHWQFEEGDSNSVSDSANAHHGVAEGDYDWVQGKIGNWAMEFSGGRVLVPDHAQLRPQNAVSATAWVFVSETQDESNRVVVKGADNYETYALQVDGDDEASLIIRDSDPCGPTNYNVATDDIYFNEWMHLAGVVNGDANTLSIYVNGQLAESVNDANFMDKGLTLSQDTNDLAIGNRSDSFNRSLDAVVDDTRIYDRALTDAEVAWIATEGSGYWSLESPANLYNQEPAGSKAINIRDLAMVLEVWLQQRLWPQ